MIEIIFPGIHQPGDAQHFEWSCISINRLWRRVKAVLGKVLVDSGAFTELARFGFYKTTVAQYAAALHRLWTNGIVQIVAAVAQDYMCEPFMLKKTGLTVLEHQRLTVERYDALLAALRDIFGGEIPFHVMPVLQGYTPAEYQRHIEMYGDRLTPGMWVGVGSVCKRQGKVGALESVLLAIKEVRPDLRLHGFRREDNRLRQPNRRPRALQRRQHGVELRSSKARSQCERLARGARLPRSHVGAVSAPRVSTKARLTTRLQKQMRLADRWLRIMFATAATIAGSCFRRCVRKRARSQIAM